MKFNSSKNLARYLGCSQAAVCRWRAAGMPFKMTKGLGYEYELGEVIDWLCARSKRHRAWIVALEEKLRKQIEQDKANRKLWKRVGHGRQGMDKTSQEDA